jgi:FrmR/RcnR family transcriptional regulator, repressor of frmRAB operon
LKRRLRLYGQLRADRRQRQRDFAKEMGAKNERLSKRPHLLRDKRGLVNRTRRLRGQVDAIERALDGEASCSDLLQRITAARGAINGLMAEVLEEHVREYLVDPISAEEVSREDAAEELIEIIHSYLT